MSVVFLTTDLMFSSRLCAAARTAGVAAHCVASAEEAIDKVATADARLVILDLNSNIDPALVVPRFRERAAANGPLAIVAYAPHVHEHKLAAATAARCDEVLTQGQFNRRMDELVAKYAAGDDPGAASC